MNILEIKKLSVDILSQSIYLPILQNIDISIQKGEVLSIVGESGCGKSLTALSITKLLPEKITRYTSGSINFLGEDILNYTNEQLMNVRGKEISYIFQDPFTSLNPIKKIKDQIIESFIIHISKNKKEAIEKAEFLLNKVGVNDIKTRLESYPGQMSGGILQRISIAMALMCDPILLIADEPTSALDVSVQSQLIELLMDIKNENQMSILFISHDIGVVSNIADKIVVMYAGQVIEESNYLDIIQNPLHPYTHALINSIPSLDKIKDGSKLESIQGIVPAPQDYPQGCHFQDRCSKSIDICSHKKPEYLSIKHRKIRCFLFGDKSHD
ncbi:MAG: ABC transporter ATP-binding protein [Leptospiraceae bacterium]|nr:ABC transporter ATP-binding protein [Leptospiraceae bacterium]